MELQNQYNVGIYCRLSKDDDGQTGESVSIGMQKTMLSNYVAEQGWHVFDYYCDDGYSGTNFERPNWKRLLSDIEQEKVNMVITKDLSRLGRDYIKTGFYTEVFFPDSGVRYIALNDGIDTIRNDNDIAPFKNILNEMYAKDCSRKVKAAYKIKMARGDHHGAYAPFGYRKDPETVGRLLVDEVSGQTVKLIFDLAKQGYGTNRIRTYLVEHKIITPAAYRHQENPAYFAHLFTGTDEQEKYKWSVTAVARILKDEVYIGKIVHNKEISLSYKTKKRVPQSRDKWMVLDGVHEPLVDMETWDTIQNRLKSRVRLKGQKFDNLFSRLVRCDLCGWSMNLASQPSGKNRRRFYLCGTYRQFGRTRCSPHNINYQHLYDLVLSDIQQYAKIAFEDEKGLLELLTNDESQRIAERKSKVENEQKGAQKRLNELDVLFPKLYEDNAAGRLTDRNYALLSERYQREQQILVEQLADLAKQSDKLNSAYTGAEDWVRFIKQYTDIQELDRLILNELIDKIIVHEREVRDGVKYQTVDIYYRFVGQLDDRQIESGTQGMAQSKYIQTA